MRHWITYIEGRGQSFVVLRETPYGKEYWNNKDEDWIPSQDIHGPSARNPKCSYFRSYGSALRASERLNKEIQSKLLA